jgi:hypothetical protein
MPHLEEPEGYMQVVANFLDRVEAKMGLFKFEQAMHVKRTSKNAKRANWDVLPLTH